MNTPIDKSIFNETGCIRKDQLLRYRDKQLSGSEQHEVEEHLVDCILCSEALEGLALVSGFATLDSLNREVAGMVSPSPVHAFRPWLAAAAMAGVIALSYFTYTQYKNMSSERLAVNETSQPVVEEPGTAPAETSAPVEAAPRALSGVQENKAAAKQMHLAETESQAEKNMQEQVQESFVESAAAEPEKTGEVAVVSDMEIQVAPSQNLASFSTAIKNNGNQNITYVDNVKVIDYNTYESEDAIQADVPRSTSSKYQNSKKKDEAAAAEQKSGMTLKHKADYLDLIADPVILFNNGRYESANAGFDKLLKLNNNDQNAAFYKGLSLYNLKQYDPALDLLEPISNDSTSPFMEEAMFYTARSCIGNGDTAKGKIILEQLSNNNGFYSRQASQELKKLK